MHTHYLRPEESQNHLYAHTYTYIHGHARTVLTKTCAWEPSENIFSCWKNLPKALFRQTHNKIHHVFTPKGRNSLDAPIASRMRVVIVRREPAAVGISSPASQQGKMKRENPPEPKSHGALREPWSWRRRAQLLLFRCFLLWV